MLNIVIVEIFFHVKNISEFAEIVLRDLPNLNL